MRRSRSRAAGLGIAQTSAIAAAALTALTCHQPVARHQGHTAGGSSGQDRATSSPSPYGASSSARMAGGSTIIPDDAAALL